MVFFQVHSIMSSKHYYGTGQYTLYTDQQIRLQWQYAYHTGR